MSSKGHVTWLGHASALVDIDGNKVLIDPLGRKRCAPLEGYSSVLITHSHVDHLNRWTLAQLDKSAHLVVPKGAAPVVADLGFAKVTEVEPGDQFAAGGLDITTVDTRHDNGRWRKGDKPICTGFVIERGGYAVHHAGDVDMSDFDVFDELGDRFDIDVTMLPIGGLLPVSYYRWRKASLDRGVHIDPDTALDLTERLQSSKMVPVHWGTVNLRLSPPSGPRRRLEAIAADSERGELVCVLGHGESVSLHAGDVNRGAGEADTGDQEADDDAEPAVVTLTGGE